MIGLLAIVLWSTIVGMIKVVSNHFGALGGAALLYTLATILLWLTLGMPNIRAFPRKYLIWGTILFVSYEICLALSIGYTRDSRQAIEVGMVNYLWPSLTILASVLLNKQRASWLLMPGILLSTVGIIWVLSGEAELSLSEMMHNISSNPLSYALAFVGAIIWSAYCIVTAKYAAGKNGVTFFFLLVSLTLWIQYLSVYGASIESFHISGAAIFALICASSAIGFGYAAWNIGILHGSVITLATASYFTPILSALFASLLLGEILSFSFWQGVGLVSLGSICCFVSTRVRKTSNYY